MVTAYVVVPDTATARSALVFAPRRALSAAAGPPLDSLSPKGFLCGYGPFPWQRLGPSAQPKPDKPHSGAWCVDSLADFLLFALDRVDAVYASRDSYARRGSAGPASSLPVFSFTQLRRTRIYRLVRPRGHRRVTEYCRLWSKECLWMPRTRRRPGLWFWTERALKNSM
jgi:hypothetical protein